MERPPLWADRREAGVELGDALLAASVGPEALVLGLPRGGVVVAAEVARALGAELDALVVCKVGVPWHPELALGAVGGAGVRVRNENVMRYAGLSEPEVEQVYALAEKEVERKESALRLGRLPPRITGRPVIIVDDGLATGATALAAAQIIRAQAAAEITLAVPVAPRDYDARIDEEVDRFLALAQPRRFSSVGTWYRDFRQVEDEQVRALLRD
ncbi:MAG TPA: phosphoribosyltransferase family protein [Jiangellaceae bacterium]|jgi:putative phosphoribosyl transferase